MSEVREGDCVTWLTAKSKFTLPARGRVGYILVGDKARIVLHGPQGHWVNVPLDRLEVLEDCEH